MDINDIEILLVEDDEGHAELTLRALKQSRPAVRSFRVSDGAEALAFLFGEGAYSHRNATNAPKLVLLDIKLPLVDGFEVLRAIRADERTKLMPVVMMSSSQEDRDVSTSYREGANSFVMKPLQFESFVKTVSGLGFYWLTLNRPPP